MDDEDFLAAVEADNTGTPVEDQPPEEADPKPEPEQPAPEENALSEPATPTEPPVIPEAPKPEPEQKHAPIAALLDERDKRKALEAELAQLRAQQAQQQPVQAPDPYEDPEGFAQYQTAQVQNIILNQTLNTSERFARKEHGAETVEAAKVWAQQRFAQDPFYQQQVLTDPDPYERVVKDYRAQQLLSKVTDPSDFDAFLAWKAAQDQLQQQQAASAQTAAAPPNQAPSIPPRSLASAPSAGNVLTDVPQSDEDIFEETFGKRK